MQVQKFKVGSVHWDAGLAEASSMTSRDPLKPSNTLDKKKRNDNKLKHCNVQKHPHVAITQKLLA